MEEKILTTKKNGMAALVLTVVLYLCAIAGLVASAVYMIVPGIVVSGIWLCLGWIPLVGLKVLRPNEALVLTLFGKYVGTLKGNGFYYVNPFCTAVNPAAKTKLNQSGDVDHGAAKRESMRSPAVCIRSAGVRVRQRRRNRNYLSSRQAIPGSSSPSRNSSDAPPPVEM